MALIIGFFATFNSAQTLAPNPPGNDAQWASAGKQGVGTSATLESKVWFTLQGGALTEVYYPNVAVGNVHLLQFVVVNPKTKKVETERDNATHEIKVLRPDSLTFQQINTAKSGEWKITKTYTTDVKRDSVLIDVKFEGKGHRLFVYYDPSLSNSGMHDTAWTEDGVLLANDKEIYSALVFSHNKEQKQPDQFRETTNGYLGVNDGLTKKKNDDYKRVGKERNLYDEAKNGNVVQFAKIPPEYNGATYEQGLGYAETSDYEFTLALGFGKEKKEALNNARQSLFKGFENTQKEYEKGWSDYVKTLPKVDEKYQAQFNMAAMILKAHEDKTFRGANIASMSVPWGGGDNANEDNVGGYHLVWSRDLYQVFTAYMALGNRDAAERALDFLLKVQQKPDGSFPQNSWLDGKPFWGSLQMDEVAYPLIMAYQLKRFDKETYEKHLKKAADFIVANGPKTPQERWEEEGGYSPSTIAAEIAGLVCVAEIAKKNNDLESAEKYLKTADEWESNIEKWTATTTGKYGDGNYYLRITQNGKPDAGEKIELNNGAGFFDEREIVDAGFLELVRLGIKSPDDPLIMKSVKVIDEIIKVNTPNGEAFYRYNHDGYGEMDDGRRWNWDGKYTGKGRLWVLLSGERGQYELALGNFFQSEAIKQTDDSDRVAYDIKGRAIKLVAEYRRLDAMLGFANEGLMIPEQVWDKKEVPKADSQFSPNLQLGEGTGSATPLAWSMAQFIRLAVNLKVGKNLDTPDVVYERYVLGNKPDLRVTMGAPQNLPNPKIDLSKILVLKKNKFPFELRRQIINSKASPKIAGNKAYFYYNGKAKSVSLAGDFSGWKPTINLEEIEEDFFVKEIEFPETARVEYKMIVDGEWMTDPMNPVAIDNGVGGENSVLEMPDYQPTKWADSSGMTKVAIAIETIDSKIYGEREIQVYVPEGFEKTPLPVMYLQDGTDYMNRADAITIQRNLVKANKIKPFIMVFIDYKDRMKEYWASDDYAKYLATEIIPLIDKNYKTLANRENRYIFGASLGGVTSIWTALKYPQVFANIGGQSNSFWIDDERVVKELGKQTSDKKFRFYIDDGVFEGVEDSNKIIKILRAKGFEVTYIEGQTGHNWTAWKDRLADAFVYFMN